MSKTFAAAYRERRALNGLRQLRHRPAIGAEIARLRALGAAIDLDALEAKSMALASYWQGLNADEARKLMGIKETPGAVLAFLQSIGSEHRREGRRHLARVCLRAIRAYRLTMPGASIIGV